MSVIVGAYAASPSHSVWRPDQEADFFALLAEVPGFRGLELPWLGMLHRHDGQWLLDHLRPEWDLVVTDIGGTVGRLASDPAFGLASIDPDGRRRAIAEVARMRDDVERLNQLAGRRAVLSVELHSAPLAHSGSAAALAESLRELSAWEWGGSTLFIEHCDALVDAQDYEKGYLPLGAEIEAIVASGQPVGLSINWGRSAVELRDADLVLDHIGQARDSGLLRAVVLSGASSEQNQFGPAWADAHLPFDHDEPTSLLTVDRASAALIAAGDLEWIGIKLGHRPLDASVVDRVRVIERTIGFIEQRLG